MLLSLTTFAILLPSIGNTIGPIYSNSYIVYCYYYYIIVYIMLLLLLLCYYYIHTYPPPIMPAHDDFVRIYIPSIYIVYTTIG